MRPIQIIWTLVGLLLGFNATAGYPGVIDFEWEHHYGVANEETLGKVIATDDRGWLFAGSTNEEYPYESDILLLKVNSAMQEEWQSRLDLSTGETCQSGVETDDHGFLLIVNFDNYPHGYRDNVFRLVHVGARGQLISQTDTMRFGRYHPIKLLKLPDDRYALIFVLNDVNESRSKVIILDSAGNTLSTFQLPEHWALNDAVSDEEGNIIFLTAQAQSSLYLSKYSTDGREIWSNSIGRSGDKSAHLTIPEAGVFTIAVPTSRNDTLISIYICNEAGEVAASREIDSDIKNQNILFTAMEDGYVLMTMNSIRLEFIRLSPTLIWRAHALFTSDQLGFDPTTPTDLERLPGTGFALFGSCYPLNQPDYGATGSDFFGIRFSATVELESTYRFVRPNGSFERAADIVACREGGYAMLVMSNDTPEAVPKVSLYRTDEDGDTLWTRSYHIPNMLNLGLYSRAGIMDMVRDWNGNFYALGVCTSPDTARFWLLKCDPEGDSLWTQYISPPGAHNNEFNPKLIFDVEENLILSLPYSIPYDENSYTWGGSVLKFSRDGECLATYAPDWFVPVDILMTSSDELVVLDYRGELHWLDSDLNPYRTLQLDYENDFSYICESFIHAPDGGWFICGEPHDCGCTCSDVRRWGPNGERIFTTERLISFGKLYPGANNSVIFMLNGGYFYTLTPDSGIVIGSAGTNRYPNQDGIRFCSQIIIDGNGFTCAGSQSDDVWIGHASFDELATSEQATFPTSISLMAPFPNPFNSSTTISFSVPPTLAGGEKGGVSLRVYDLSGRLVEDLTPHSKIQIPNSKFDRVVWDATGTAPGVYLIRLETSSSSAVQKVVLLK